MVGIILCPMHHNGIQTSPAVDRSHDGIVNAVPLLELGVLLSLLMDDFLHTLGVTHSGLIDTEEGQQLSYSLIENTMPMLSPLISPIMNSEPHRSVKVSKYHM